ncbi:MAG: DUF3307 domain-containing protein [Patescibacteria group bacterium]|nr:DUF3307 domain-containing protein [Patescibacteria group bacterium]
MVELFVAMLLGHFVGDYPLQNNAMALGKSGPGWKGYAWCLLHCTLYTLAVCAFVATVRPDVAFNPLFAGLVFLSHYPIDRWSLAKYWIWLMHSRDIEATLKLPASDMRDIMLPFSAIIYVATDNTIHWVLMWFIALHFAGA